MTSCREDGARLFLRGAQGKMRQWLQIAPREILSGHKGKKSQNEHGQTLE